MNWWEWVFSGVGVLGLGLLIEWRRRRSQSSGHNAAITAQGARVSDSPVASGTAVTQTVSTHHHYYPSGASAPEAQPVAVAEPVPAVPKPAQITPARPEPPQPERQPQERHSQIAATATRVIRVDQTGRTEWSDRGPYFNQDAIVIEFTNEAGRGFRNSRHMVRSSLAFSDERGDIFRITGGWVNQQTDLASFKVEESHKLIVGVLLGERLFAVEQTRALVSLGSETCEMAHRPLNGFRQGVVRVRLTDINSQMLLYEGHFDIGIQPLRIAPRQHTS